MSNSPTLEDARAKWLLQYGLTSVRKPSHVEAHAVITTQAEIIERLRGALQWVNDEVDMGDGSAKYVKETLEATDPAVVRVK